MDVAILGTGACARQFARLFVTRAGSLPPADGASSPTMSLYGEEATAVMDAIDAIEEVLGADGVVDPETKADRIDRTTDLERAVSGTTLVIETRSGDLESRRNQVAVVGHEVPPETAIAFPTVEEGATAVAVALEHPERGVAFETISPADTGVIEIVRADHTNDATVRTVQQFAEAIDWSAVVVNDAPGQIGRRLQLALEVEAMRAVEADVATPADIDALMTDGFGHAAGPLSSADRAGLEQRLETLDRLAGALGDRFEPPAILREKVQAGELGRATGKGFRVWEDGIPVDETNGDEQA